ncbi:MAG: dockerin type I repeat-containing protein [Ruminococcus sp.]|nr:dockerin type I repeat-containing protein [Ruminococcus sp.]
MKKFMSLFLAIIIVTGAVFMVSFTAYAEEADTSPVAYEEPMQNVLLDVSALATDDESFAAYIWTDNGDDRWEAAQASETGYHVLKMHMGENAVFALMNGDGELDWFSVKSQTEDTRYTGEYNCAVLSYSDTEGRMNVEWTSVVDKTDLVQLLGEAEVYLFDEASKYTYESVFELQCAYYDALHLLKGNPKQAGVDMATDRLTKAIRGLITKEEAGIVDKSDLELAISTAVSYQMSLENFTASSWNYMMLKLDEAYAVDMDENASQKEVDFAAQELFDAIEALESEDEQVGDVDGDGLISVRDATEIQYYLARLVYIAPNRYDDADVNRDGVVSVKDATMIQKFLAGIIPSL